MIENQTLQAFPIFGDNASKVQPEAAVYTNGYAPNDVLPAEHFNWFMGNASNAITILNQGISSIEAELNTLIACAGMTSDVSCTSQVYNAVMYQINNCISKYAIKNHASNTNTYGLGNAANYGHVQLSDSINSSCGVANGVAATPLAVKTVSDKLNALCGDNLPKQSGTAAVGTSSKFAREDHVHPVMHCLPTTSDTESPWYVYTNYCCTNQMYCMDVGCENNTILNRYGICVCCSINATNAVNATNACIVKDCCNNYDIHFAYGGSTLCQNPNYLAAWNGYTLRAVTPSYVTSGAALAIVDAYNNEKLTFTYHCSALGNTNWLWASDPNNSYIQRVISPSALTVGCATCATNAFCSCRAQYAATLNFFSDNTNIEKKILCCYVNTSAQMYYLYVVNCTNNNLLGVFTSYGPDKNIKILEAGEGICLYCNSCCSCVVNARYFTYYIKFG
jgi:hypothetical protein